MHAGMSFFSRGSHGRGNKGRGNWNRGPRRPRFSIHFDADSQELGQLFQAIFFNWIGQGVVQPRPERPPFQVPQAPIFLCPLMSHCNLRFPKMTDGKRLSTRQSPNIVAGPICLYLLLHLTTRLSKLPLTTRQCNPPMLERD
jgi:hypothetical protein